MADTAYDFCQGIASGSDKWESEDQAQYEHFNPRVKTVREVHRKEPTLPQTKNSVVTESNSPPKVPVTNDLGQTRLVHDVMEKTAYFCFENQSVDEAWGIMRENDLQYLLVLDKNMRIVSTVRMKDLMLGEEDRPQSGG
ncbi:MAG: CBS domain-containing protein [Terrimicrobiaceae bacterium]